MNTITCTVPFNTLVRSARPTQIDWSTIAQPDDSLDLSVLARRVITKIEPEKENAIQFVKDHVWDMVPDNFPAWNMLEDLFTQIRSLPGSAHAFRYLLQNAETARTEARSWWTSLNPYADILEIKVYGMCKFLADRAQSELDEYERGREDAIRPADTYRAYGLALRYATEELGSRAACRVLCQLMMASPLPVDELENPDWVDPYTSEKDTDYTYLKVKQVEAVSSDGNLPAMILDLMENMDYGEQFDLLLRLKEQSNQTLDDYWIEFREAQRSGYVNLPEPEDEHEEPEFDVIEKDFNFTEDLKIDHDAKNHAKQKLVNYGAGGRIDLYQGVRDASALMVANLQKAIEEEKRFNWDEAHHKFLNDPRVKAFLRKFQEIVWSNRIPDMMAILVPLQNTFAFWEEDLYQIKVGGTFRTLAHWYNIVGEEFLEQLANPNYVDYGDKKVNEAVGNRFVPLTEVTMPELDEIMWLTIHEQQELYKKGEMKRAEWAQKKGFPYKQDAKWHPAFIDAEVQTAFMGEGGSNTAQTSGWNAWRQSIDAEANALYKRERSQGKSNAQAMKLFWDAVKANKNRIKSVSSQGLTLRSGRLVAYHIAEMKFRNNEIPCELSDLYRLRDLLRKQGWGKQISNILDQLIQKAEVELTLFECNLGK